MNWLKTLFNRQRPVRQFNPGKVPAWPDDPLTDDHDEDDFLGIGACMIGPQQLGASAFGECRRMRRTNHPQHLNKAAL